MTQICNCCINAVLEISVGPEFPNPPDLDMAKIAVRNTGKDLPDHLCDAVEEPGAQCGCACQDKSPASF